MKTHRFARTLALAAAVAVAAACDGPSGPGYLNASLEGPTTLGSAVIEVSGAGILSFDSPDGTRLFSAPTGTPDTYRVVLVSETAGALPFRVEVSDPKAVTLTGSVVSAADGSNAHIGTPQAFTLRFERAK